MMWWKLFAVWVVFFGVAQVRAAIMRKDSPLHDLIHVTVGVGLFIAAFFS